MGQVIDLKNAKPVKKERYLIDTNVWFWSTYVASKGETLPQQPRKYQIEHYPKFIEKLLQNDAIPCHTALSLTELANVIERTQFDIYKTKVRDPNFDKKAFRKIPNERTQVLTEIQTAWDAVNQMSTCIDCTVDITCMSKSSELMASAPVDPYDAIYLKIMSQKKIDYLVSDDIDFMSLHNVILITANPNALSNRN